MPELPDISAYLVALEPRILGHPLEGMRIASPFLLRSVSPPPAALAGRRVTGLRRLGKRIVVAFEGDRFAVVHLMIAGRLHWKERGVRLAGKLALAAFDFPTGSLTMTEAGSRKRASLHLVEGETELAAHDPGGIEPLDVDIATFAAALRRERHTLKRALTDPHLLSGVGNAYSDEILHRARMSPTTLTTSLDDAAMARLHDAVVGVLREWIDRLAGEARRAFPEKVTAFRAEMAVHGRFGKPCPICASPVQRIRYADNEANYCATCQTGGKLLADRGLSRLLGSDWPRTLDELEQFKASRSAR
ncbi:MAG TPA: DNA-formamidopyrimidine glycosylase family protein [Candidatus Polarisedimenticolaceae bacterium]